jgi:hypothetical protein
MRRQGLLPCCCCCCQRLLLCRLRHLLAEGCLGSRGRRESPGGTCGGMLRSMHMWQTQHRVRVR